MRIMAVISAAFLVAAFAVATLLPLDLALRDMLALIDRGWPARLQSAVAGQSSWLWNNVLLPLLIRPAWLPPAALGVICGGAAATLASTGGGQQRSRRRRS